MKHELRDYQKNGENDIRVALRNGSNAVIYTLPTGAGKTHVFTSIATKAALLGNRTLIIVHRSYLWRQVSRKLTDLGVDHGIIAPGHTVTADLIQIASILTLIRRLDRIPPPNIIIFDEAHHVVKENRWGKVASYFSQSKIIGVTATPCRTNGQGLGIEDGNFFDTLISGPSYSKLTPEYLTPFKVFAPDMSIDFKGIKKIGGDWAKNELAKRVDNKKIYGNVPEHYRKICYGVPAIAFCVSVKHCYHVAEEFKLHGISAEVVHGKTPEKQREYLFGGLADGKYKILCSCDLVSEGFDVPVCGASILLRPTMSLVLYMQQCGRSTRKAQGKEFAYIIDHVGNVQRHGMPNIERIWDLKGEKIKIKNRDNDEPDICIRICPQCFNSHSPSPVCPECGYIYNSIFKPPSVVETELKEIKEKEEKEKKAKKRLIYFKKTKCKSLEDFVILGSELNYKPGWAFKMYEFFLKNNKNKNLEWEARFKNCQPIGD